MSGQVVTRHKIGARILVLSAIVVAGLTSCREVSPPDPSASGCKPRSEAETWNRAEEGVDPEIEAILKQRGAWSDHIEAAWRQIIDGQGDTARYEVRIEWSRSQRPLDCAAIRRACEAALGLPGALISNVSHEGFDPFAGDVDRLWLCGEDFSYPGTVFPVSSPTPRADATP